MTSFRKSLARTVLTAVGVVLAGNAAAADISGAGATFPYPIYAKWADAYKKETGIGLNYQSIGSGGGIKQIKAKTVTFGASDKPLKPSELSEAGLSQFPMVMGAIVPVINVDGIAADQMVLDGTTLADIFYGKISKWDDPAIAKLNPGLKLPKTAIAVVHRSDGSGTTYNFTYYLAEVSNNWRVNVGVEASVEWQVGIGGKGNEGVANMVTQTKGSIGYVEFAYAKQNKMTYTKMINKDGKTVSPSMATFQAAAANADWSKHPGYALVLANQPGADSWPMTAATFILFQKQAKSPEDTLAALKFFDWAFTKGDAMAEELVYIPMPDAVVEMIEKTWSTEIKDASGAPIWK